MSEGSLYERVMVSVPDAARPRPRVRGSAAVVLWRRVADDLEVFWVERSQALPFMGGFHAFPGGTRARADKKIAVRGSALGIEAGPEDGGMPPAVLDGHDLEPIAGPGILAAAVRELFEETGVLLAQGAAGMVTPDDRRRLLEGDVGFAELVAERGLTLDASPLVYSGRWLTPPLGPLRFDNRFFLLEWTPELFSEPEVCGGELTGGEWITPRAAIEKWRGGEVVTAPPILHILEVLADKGPEAGLDALRHPEGADLGPYRRIEFRPGVLMFPLPTPTLPPATHTNTYVVGTSECVLVDPGTPSRDHLEGLVSALRQLELAGRRVVAIWLTHHHPDHVGGVETLRDRLGVPVCAHAETASRLEVAGVLVDRLLGDGERVNLTGDPPFPVRVIHTPGHARGHLVFLDETFGSLIGGDLTAGIGTIVIDPPEGDMDAYLESLRKARALGARTLFPAHGPPTIAVAAKLDEYLRHRSWREEKILASWTQGLRGRDLLASAYDDTPATALPLAERQLLAHLVRLERQGVVPAGAAGDLGAGGKV